MVVVVVVMASSHIKNLVFSARTEYMLMRIYVRKHDTLSTIVY
jgi:hypothetical protein